MGKNIIWVRVFLLVIITVLCISFRGYEPGQAKPLSGKDLIEMMHERYMDKFYKSLTFSQEVLRYNDGKTDSVEVMHEAYLSPGNLILKFGDWESGEGLIFKDDSLYTIKGGKVSSVEYRIHDVLLLGLEVYNIDPEIAIEKLERLNYNLDLISEERCMGRQAWLAGDPAGNCFWVDKENLLFLKVRVRSNNRPRSVEFSKYEIIDDVPVATVIKFYNDKGDLEMVEKYFNVKPFNKLEKTIFEPENFVKARW